MPTYPMPTNQHACWYVGMPFVLFKFGSKALLLCTGVQCCACLLTACCRCMPPFLTAVQPHINPSSRHLQRSVEQLHAWDARRRLTVSPRGMHDCGIQHRHQCCQEAQHTAAALCNMQLGHMPSPSSWQESAYSVQPQMALVSVNPATAVC
jgi:hypothetical protein